MQKIMVIEDDTAIQEELALLLENEGYMPLVVTNFTDIPGQAVLERPDLILLDIGLPGRDGFSLCAALRKAVSAPVIFVTSRDAGVDEVRALSLGGDDYITKPFSLAELTARVEAHLRRESRARHGSMKMSGELFIDYAGRCVYCKEQAVPFSKKEFDIIEFLSLHAGQVFDRERIYERIWGYDAEGSSDILKEHIRRIRAKLAQVTDREYIETVWGCGYKWVN